MTEIGWWLYLTLGALLEGLALAGHGTPLTAALRDIRYDAIGRFVMLAFSLWMIWHIDVRPRDMASFTWRDNLPIALGVAWALLETLKRISL